ncbi:glycoside hydrolase family 43 protein [Undibacterium sp. Jales W-56]|uniref:glycoside hydrolase family 43 protein n=1 Tax=Undibacterium sp. Jales W-56 TaxID=2897325 RepID=UPI0021D23872|nr:glycoside hydrolase family 43 protein [Undibacterium sp. Jales W-56]MCU6432589.1 glycoside hydrolase family 43 protein [Undibacterium sp. Jales W-56]
MIPTQILRAIAVAAAFTFAACLAGCGGGGSASVAGSGSTATTGTTVPGAGTASSTAGTTTQTSISFNNVSVHDPSIVKVGGTYYVFGSHLAAAKSTDLMNWSKFADGVNPGNSLFNDVTKALADTFSWSQVVDLWAPDVIQLDDGKFYFYYNSCKGDSPRSALGVAVADKIEGPYVNKQIFLKSGMWGAVSEDGVTIYDAKVHPNTVDPNVFRDKDGNLWMIYGSYSGGIFILAMDKTTGMPKPNQGYGKHLMGGNHARIEGAYVMYSPQSHYYYLFTSFGGLDANGAYNMRVARSANPDGPYLDAKGNDMASVKANPNLPLFDDASIAPYGQKLMGNHQFALAPGETGTPLGYVSAGHNSAYYEAATNQYFLIFHTRFPNMGEAHEVRVHEMFINEDAWLVVSPFRYAPLSKSTAVITADVSSKEAEGSYKMINHGKDISVAIKPSQNIKLNADGSISGAATGSWKYKTGKLIQITLDNGGIFNGVLSRQWNTNANNFVVTFTAQSADGVSIWGARTGN